MDLYNIALQALPSQSFSFNLGLNTIKLRLKTLQNFDNDIFMDLNIDGQDVLIGVKCKCNVNLVDMIQTDLQYTHLSGIYFFSQATVDPLNFNNLGSLTKLYVEKRDRIIEITALNEDAKTEDSGGDEMPSGPVDWTDIKNKPDFGQLAYRDNITVKDIVGGISYGDIKNTPTFGLLAFKDIITDKDIIGRISRLHGGTSNSLGYAPGYNTQDLFRYLYPIEFNDDMTAIKPTEILSWTMQDFIYIIDSKISQSQEENSSVIDIRLLAYASCLVSNKTVMNSAIQIVDSPFDLGLITLSFHEDNFIIEICNMANKNQYAIATIDKLEFKEFRMVTI